MMPEYSAHSMVTILRFLPGPRFVLNWGIDGLIGSSRPKGYEVLP